MKRLLALTLLALTLASPVSAHHVKVATAGTDAEAYTAFLVEYEAQRQALNEAWGLMANATSVPERSDASLAVEGVLQVTLTHLASLDVRECFATQAAAASIAIDAIASAHAAYRANDQALFETWIARANDAHTLAVSKTLAELQPCDGETVG